MWTGTKAGTRGTYGTFNPTTKSDGKRAYAHRWIYEQLVGPIPDGHEIDHVKERGCAGGLCVNVQHLEAVTPAENQRRRRLDVCSKGLHDLSDPENVRWDNRGLRIGCKPCRNEWNRARYMRDKAKDPAGEAARKRDRYLANHEETKAKAREYYWRKKAEREASAQDQGS